MLLARWIVCRPLRRLAEQLLKARARDVLLEEQPALPQRSAEGARVVRRREAGE